MYYRADVVSKKVCVAETRLAVQLVPAAIRAEEPENSYVALTTRLLIIERLLYA